jgi:hypothetical protein
VVDVEQEGHRLAGIGGAQRVKVSGEAGPVLWLSVSRSPAAADAVGDGSADSGFEAGEGAAEQG